MPRMSLSVVGNIHMCLNKMALLALNFLLICFHFQISTEASALSRQTKFVTATDPFFKPHMTLGAVSDVGAGGGKIFNVENFGAVGNGVQDNTAAFGKAWSAACKTVGSTLLVPGGRSFLLKYIIFQGPCVNGFTFQVDGTIVAPANPGQWTNKKNWVIFWQLQGFILQGKGTFDGQGSMWWATCRQGGCGDRPSIMLFEACQQVAVRGVSLVNSPSLHLTMDTCVGFGINGIKITAPRDSPNTDGFDIYNSNNIKISNTHIGTGDDCIALSTGSTNIHMQNIACGPGHGISVGGLGDRMSHAEVSGITVDGATFTNTNYGVRIKTMAGGTGFARDITFRNIRMVNTWNPVLIDQTYCYSGSACYPNDPRNVAVSDVVFDTITGTTTNPVGVKFACSRSVPCKNITMNKVSLTVLGGGIAATSCQNAYGITTGGVKMKSCLN